MSRASALLVQRKQGDQLNLQTNSQRGPGGRVLSLAVFPWSHACSRLLALAHACACVLSAQVLSPCWTHPGRVLLKVKQSMPLVCHCLQRAAQRPLHRTEQRRHDVTTMQRVLAPPRHAAPCHATSGVERSPTRDDRAVAPTRNSFVIFIFVLFGSLIAARVCRRPSACAFQLNTVCDDLLAKIKPNNGSKYSSQVVDVLFRRWR